MHRFCQSREESLRKVVTLLHQKKMAKQISQVPRKEITPKKQEAAPNPTPEPPKAPPSPPRPPTPTPPKKTESSSSKKGEMKKQEATVVKPKKSPVPAVAVVNLQSQIQNILKKSKVAQNVGDSNTQSVIPGSIKGVGVSELQKGIGNAPRFQSNQSMDSAAIAADLKRGADTGMGVGTITQKTGTFSGGPLAKTVVMGGLDPDVIRRILMQYLGQFAQCQKTQNPQGIRVMLNFLIDSVGNVSKAAVTAAPGSSSISAGEAGCVASILKQIKFPENPSKGVTEVQQGLRFSQVQ